MDYCYIFQKITLNGPTFSSFPDLPISKKTGPQRKKDAHGPSLHIRFLSTSHFFCCIYCHFSTFWAKPTFFNYCLILIFCVSPIQIWETQKYYYFKIEVLFQNKNLCWWCVPRRDVFCWFFICPGSTNVICGNFGTIIFEKC